MKIAVILVNYNGLSDTLECIESVKKCNSDTVIFVVDNGSKNDETIEIQNKYPDVQTIRCEKNLGFAGGNNVAIKKALDGDFEYIMLLNNDTIVDKNFISHLIENVDEHTVALPNMFYYDHPKELWFGGGVIHRFSGKVSHLHRTDSKPYEINFATGCCVMVHRSVFERCGLLSEEYFMYCEDMDFSIRLQQMGIKIMMQPTAKIWHKVAKSSPKNGNAFRIYYNTRNRLILVKKFASYFTVFTLPYIKLTSTTKMFLAKIRGKNDVYTAFNNAMIDYKKYLFKENLHDNV